MYGPARPVQGVVLALEVQVRPRTNARAKCSGCGKAAPGYATLEARRFEFVPLWGIAVFLVYAMHRVSCRSCGVKVEMVPWASGKHQLTDTYAWFLAQWARRLSWKEVGERGDLGRYRRRLQQQSKTDEPHSSWRPLRIGCARRALCAPLARFLVFRAGSGASCVLSCARPALPRTVGRYGRM